ETGYGAGAHGEQAEARLAHSPALLRAHLDRHGLPVEQADAAAPERHDVGGNAGPEVEDVRAFEEEPSLLGEELTEAGDVGAPLIDFRFREVGVERKEGERIRADTLG